MGENPISAANRVVGAERRAQTAGLVRANPAWKRGQDAATVLADGAITFTLGTTANSVITSAKSIPHTSDVFRYLGGYPYELTDSSSRTYYRNAANTRTDGSPAGVTRWGWDFMYDEDVFDLGFRANVSPISLRFWIDGHPHSATFQDFTPNSSSLRRYLNVNFGSFAHRHILIQTLMGEFYELSVPNSATVWRADEIDLGPKVVVMTDSYGAGVAAAGFTSATSWPNAMATALGWVDVHNASEGGTGWTKPASEDPTLHSRHALARIPSDVVRHQPAIAVIAMGHNDYDQDIATIKANTAAGLQLIRDGSPHTAVIVIPGMWVQTPTVSGNEVPTRDAIIQASAGLYDLLIDTVGGPYPYSGTIGDYLSSSIVWGNGKATATNGSGNADLYAHDDRVHPTGPIAAAGQDGCAFIGRRIAAVIGRWIAVGAPRGATWFSGVLRDGEGNVL